jgi:hypothetical protein
MGETPLECLSDECPSGECFANVFDFLIMKMGEYLRHESILLIAIGIENANHRFPKSFNDAPR